MQNTTSAVMRKPSIGLVQTESANTGLYDLWLNSMLPAVGPSMVTGVTLSSSHQIVSQGIDSERLAEKLMQLSCDELLMNCL